MQSGESSVMFPECSSLEPTIRNAVNAVTPPCAFRSRCWKGFIRSIHLVIMYLYDTLPNLNDLPPPSIPMPSSPCRTACVEVRVSDLARCTNGGQPHPSLNAPDGLARSTSRSPE